MINKLVFEWARKNINSVQAKDIPEELDASQKLTKPDEVFEIHNAR